MSGFRGIGILVKLPREWVTLRKYAGSKRIRYGTLKRWASEGMPVLRARFYGEGAPIVRVLPILADAWIRKHHQCSIAPNRKSVVYFARRIVDGAIKIGFTSDVARRLRELRKESSRHELISARPGDKPDELALHARFASDCLGGEWFRPSAELLQEANATIGSEGHSQSAGVRAHAGASGDAGVRRIHGSPLAANQSGTIRGVG